MPDEAKVIDLDAERIKKGQVVSILWLMNELIDEISAIKPNDRSERDRKFAIVITEAEKLRAIAKEFLS